MSDQAALWQAILEHPEDDLPRLALADWLEENADGENQARAELIRTEIEVDRRLAALPERHALEAGARENLRQASGLFRLGGKVSPELEGRDAELLRDHGRHWAGACARSPFHYGFRRGFVSEIRTTAGHFLRHAERVFVEVPVQALRLDGGLRNDLTPQFWQSPFLRRLRYLSCCCVALGQDGARELANCPLLGELRELSLWATKIGPEGMECLAGARHLGGLTRLDLGVARIGPGGAHALADSPVFAGLRWLRLWSNGIGDRGLQALAGSPHLANLTDLNLGENAIGDPGWEALASSRYLTRLRTLRLSWNRIGLRGARALADSASLAGLTRLTVSGDRLGLAGITYVERPVMELLGERFGKALEVNLAACESVSF
jgi:uncharacterized protein (TIGR02996 family)